MRQSALHWRQARLAFALFGGMCAGVTVSSSAWADGCTDHILKAEKENGIPRGLMLAMSIVESGRDGKPNQLALNVGGHSVYPADTQSALKAMQDPKGRVRPNTMAGCMQIAVTSHKQAFRPLGKILDPQENVTYAARYLKRQRDNASNWAGAVARYNGGTPSGTKAYVCKVRDALNELDPDSAKVLAAQPCATETKVAIAPETRRAFDRSVQVADAGLTETK